MNVGLHPLRVLSLCAGAGGLDLGLRVAVPTARTVCWVEHEATAILALAARMEEGWLDPAPVWTDMRTLDGKPWRGAVDLVMGGIPCQPFSVAGARREADDARNLWPDTARIVRECEPEWVFIENVSGAVSYFYHAVLPELQEMGYMVEATVCEAADVGAPHRRERLFVLAHAQRSGAGDKGGQAGGRGRSKKVRQGNGAAGAVRSDAASPELAHATGNGGQATGARGSVTDADDSREQLARAERSAGSAQLEREPEGVAAKPGLGGSAMADSTESRRDGAGEHGGGPPPLPARPEQRSDAVEYASVVPQREPDDGLRAEPRSRDARAEPSRGRGFVRVANEPRSKGRSESQREGSHKCAVGTASATLGIFPPGPADRERWERILRERPDLAPAVAHDTGARAGRAEEVGVGRQGRKGPNERSDGRQSSEAPKPPVRGVVDGLADRVDLTRAHRLRLTGNGVVPLQAAYAFATLAQRFGWDVMS